MRHRGRHNGKAPVLKSGALCAFIAAVALGVVVSAAEGASSVRTRSRPLGWGPIAEFLVKNGVPIYSSIPVAKVSAVIVTRYKARSVVKVITPEKLPSPAELEEARKRVHEKLQTNRRIRFGTQIDLLRLNILTGEVIKPCPCKKLGELELFFSAKQSLKIDIGTDFFYINIGDKHCAFRSPSLRKQLESILEPRGVKPGDSTTGGSGWRRPSRKTAR